MCDQAPRSFIKPTLCESHFISRILFQFVILVPYTNLNTNTNLNISHYAMTNIRFNFVITELNIEVLQKDLSINTTHVECFK